MSLIDKAKGAAQGAVQAAVKKAAEIAPDRVIPGGKPDPLIHQKHGLVGQPISRLDGPLKVKGAARFAAEFPLAGMTYAAIAYSTIPKGRIARIESVAADRASGVILVMTHRNAPKMNPPPRFMSGEKAAAGDDIPVMQDDRVHWNGQPVALVLAETQEQADHAISLIKISYKEECATTSLADAKAKGTEVGKFQGEPLEDKIGDAEAALSEAVHCVDEVYTTPGHNHNAMELHAITVMWRGEDLVVHDATQAVSHSAWSLAHIFGIDEKQVHLTSPYVGGGFGGKTLWQHQILAAAAARMASRPVRLMLSREGVYRVVGGRSSTEQRVALGADAEGRLTALIHQGITPKSRSSAMPEPFILPTRSAYASPNIHLQVKTCYLDMLANTFMRAPGESVGTFALECAMDELAHKAGIDPIELRIRNEPARDPTADLPFSSRHIVEAYKTGAEQFGWQDHSRMPRVRQDGEWLVGTGCATATYPYYRMPGGAARITLLQEGRAIVEIAAHEMGMGTSTAQTQIAADRLGLQMNDVDFLYGDSSLPGVVLAGGSQQTAAIGMAVRVAYDQLVEDLIKLAGNDSPLAGLRSDEVVGTNRGLAKLDEQDRFESYTSILSRAKRGSVVAEGAAPQPLETMHWSMHSHGAMFCEVKVNSVTGETRVSRFLGSFDCGRIINPKTATSQFRGGIIMGIGLALMEETQFDERRGRIMNPNLSEYHIPVHLDVPQIDVMWTDIADPHAPMGAHGVGEIGITGTGAAIANAIFNATGKRVRDLPITLDKLLG
jgi:xanthine dehydrogenase YagR molybdenum-binding subunit